MKNLFFIICAILAYGSVFPLEFDISAIDDARIQKLYNFSILETNLTDIIANILLFIPFGFVGVLAFNSIRGAKSTVLFLLIGFAFAYCIQVIQLVSVGRVPWGGDAIWNVIGSAIGMFAALIYVKSGMDELKNTADFDKPPLFLGLVIILLELAPFVPTLDIGLIADNIKLVVLSPSIDWYWTLEAVFKWLACFFLLNKAAPNLVNSKRLIAIAISVLAVKFFIISSGINLSKLVGTTIAIALWLFWQSKIQYKHIFTGFVLIIALNSLYPFEFRESIGSFKWLPFTGSLQGNPFINFIALTKKLLFFSVLLWSAINVFGQKKWLIITSFAYIFLLEYTQIFFTSSVPESTDAFFIAIFAYFFVTQDILHKKNAHQKDTLNITKTALNEPSASAVPEQPVSNIIHSQTYIPALDGLRAIAALAVFMVHFQQFTDIGGNIGSFDIERLLINGNTGVALFFVLSGFLLSIPFWMQLPNNSLPDMKSYFINRVIRIIPIYYLCFFALLAIKGFQGPDANFNNIISHLFFLHNFKDYQVMSLNPPFWTLAVEVQFYILLPLIFFALCKFQKTTAQIAVCAMIIGVFVSYKELMHYLGSSANWPIQFPFIWPFGFYAESVDGGALKYSTFAHLPHFLIGVLFASFLLEPTRRKTKAIYTPVFLLSAFCIIAILSTSLDDKLLLDFGRYNFPFVPILLAILLYSAIHSSFAIRLLDFSPIRFLGIISYGIYIFHYPVQKAILLVFKRLQLNVEDQVWLYGLSTLSITLIVSWFSYKVIEKPVLDKYKQQKAHVNERSEVKKEAVMTSSSRQIAYISGSLFFIIVIIAIYIYQDIKSPRVLIEQPQWAGNIQSELIFDHHSHTKFSDGSYTASEVVEFAFVYGCDAISITDHSYAVMTEERLKELQEVRKENYGIMVFAGMEIGMPSYYQREHVNMITTPEHEELVLLSAMSALKSIDETQTDKKHEWDLSVLDAILLAPESTVASYNHPSRKVTDLEESWRDLKVWNSDVKRIELMSGAPGHQRNPINGSYNHKYPTFERWDPIFATVGGVYDQMLEDGDIIWAALAPSDFHTETIDYYPCQFSRTHVRVPERSYEGIIQGLKKGTFWADHGQLLTNYEFSVYIGEDNKRVYPGGTAFSEAETELLNIDLKIERNNDYKDDFLRYDIISNCSADGVTETSFYLPPETSDRTSFLSVSANVQQCYIRSRIVRETVENNDLAAYSNPIFFKFVD